MKLSLKPDNQFEIELTEEDVIYAIARYASRKLNKKMRRRTDTKFSGEYRAQRFRIGINPLRYIFNRPPIFSFTIQGRRTPVEELRNDHK